MRTNFIVAALLVSCLGCTSERTDQLTQQQKDQVRNEVKVVMDSIRAAGVRLDGGAVVQHYWDSPEFLAVNLDGSQFDYQRAKKETFAAYESSSSMTFLSFEERYTVLTKDVAICTFSGKVNVTLKSGHQVLFDPNAFTLVFKKIAGEWRAVFTHQSGTFTTKKVGKS